MSQKKKIIEQLKKDFKKSGGGLGGLQYSGSPMKYNKMFENQADMILKAQQPKIQPKYPSIPSYAPSYKTDYTKYRPSIPSYTPSYTKKEPTEEEKLYSKGLNFQKEGKYKEALKEFQNALKIKPDYVSALRSMGICFKALKVYNKAIENFRKAIKFNPNDSQAWKYMGNVYEKMENYRKAIESYEKAVQINSGYKEAWKDMGELYQKLGGYRNAIYCYKKVKKIAPHDKDIRRILKKFKNLKKKQK